MTTRQSPFQKDRELALDCLPLCSQHLPCRLFLDHERSPQLAFTPRLRRLHSHDGLAPHAHEFIPSPGDFKARAMPLDRDYNKRSFTIGIGGPVGTGCALPAISVPYDARET